MINLIIDSESIFTVMMFIVEIVTEVLKGLMDIKDLKLLKLLAFIVSEFVSLGTLAFITATTDITFTLSNIIEFLVLGFFLSYASQVGYDKFMSMVFELLGNINNKE